MSKTTTPYTLHTPVIGRRLWALALRWSIDKPDTQAARNEDIKSIRSRKTINGSRAINVARQAVEDAARDIRTARADRSRRQWPRRAWSHIRTALRAGRRQVNRFPQANTRITLAKRLARPIEDRLRLRTAVLLCAASTLRHGAAGGSTRRVLLTRDPSAVRYAVEIGENRDTYRGAYTGWAAKEDHHRITVPHGWLTRVHKRGLANLGGLLTLDASPLDHAPSGVDLYAATWAQQGRGYDVATVRGYLAVSGAEHYHGATAAKAVAGLARKIRASELTREWASLRDATHARFRAAVAGHENLTVRVSDARAIGACEYGIQSWCNQVGIDYERGRASLAEVLAGYEQSPAPEARGAILHALRRARRPVTLAA
jgi:hypothetical protein